MWAKSFPGLKIGITVWKFDSRGQLAPRLPVVPPIAHGIGAGAQLATFFRIRNLMRTSLALALAAAAVLAVPAQAQNSGSISATATVLSSIAVNGTDLAFGNVAQSQVKTVTPDGAGAGAFHVAGAASTPIVLNFSSLPADVGDAGLPLSAWQYMAADVNSTASLSPAAASVGATFNGTTNATGDYYVWVGATVSAGAGVAPGSYTSTTPITLDVVYQ